MIDARDDETWVIERGDAVIEKKAAAGLDALGDWERLVYCLWVADYLMRNAGDLDGAEDLYPGVLDEGCRLAGLLGLAVAERSFGLPRARFEATYLDFFGALCAEIRGAEPATSEDA